MRILLLIVAVLATWITQAQVSEPCDTLIQIDTIIHTEESEIEYLEAWEWIEHTHSTLMHMHDDVWEMWMEEMEHELTRHPHKK